MCLVSAVASRRLSRPGGVWRRVHGSGPMCESDNDGGQGDRARVEVLLERQPDREERDVERDDMRDDQQAQQADDVRRQREGERHPHQKLVIVSRLGRHEDLIQADVRHEVDGLRQHEQEPGGNRFQDGRAQRSDDGGVHRQVLQDDGERPIEESGAQQALVDDPLPRLWHPVDFEQACDEHDPDERLAGVEERGGDMMQDVALRLGPPFQEHLPNAFRVGSATTVPRIQEQDEDGEQGEQQAA